MNSRDLGADEAFARAEEMVRACVAEQGGASVLNLRLMRSAKLSC
mgnify:CR=1 FL=1